MKKKLIIGASAVGVFIALTVIVTGVIMIYKGSSSTSGGVTQEATNISRNFEDVQNEFAVDYPCGITDFDSPYVKPAKCSAAKMKKGTLVSVAFSGYVGDIKGKPLAGVRIKANNGEITETDSLGIFNLNVQVDSIKKSINIVGDKFGYSPIRDVINAEVVNGKIIPLGKYEKGFMMREIEIKNIVLESEKEITIKSEKYPGVSVTIPANGLENSKGEVVEGNITGEITYLDPNKPEDAIITPGFDGNTKQMIGINREGKQVFLESQGMVFLHFREEGTTEILQPKKGSSLTIVQPILEEDYKRFMLNKENPPSENELAIANQRAETLGLNRQDISEEEKFKIALDNDLLSVSNYWYFNQRTGLWEEWPVVVSKVDLENKIYIMKVSRLY